MTEYTLLVHNGSPDRVAVGVCPEFDGIAHIAWMTGVAEPFAAVRFRWTLRYAFFVADVGLLRPGATVCPSVTEPADPSERNLVDLTFQSAFRFANVAGRGESGVFTIRQDGTIPPGRGAIGIAIDDAPAAATQAQPNVDARFVLHPAYWVITGEHFEKGELLEEQRILAAHWVVFAEGETSLRVEV